MERCVIILNANQDIVVGNFVQEENCQVKNLNISNIKYKLFYYFELGKFILYSFIINKSKTILKQICGFTIKLNDYIKLKLNPSEKLKEASNYLIKLKELEENECLLIM